MPDRPEIVCPKCGQRLRLPTDIGGMLMACPSCGQKFQSDFKLGDLKKRSSVDIVARIFGLPAEVMARLGRYFSPKV